MSWFRVGDTAATDPRVLALADPADPLMAPACFGFFTMLGTLSANQQTDYVINPGFIALAGGAAASDLLKRCIRAGLITSLGGSGRNRRWKLIDDAPELIHIRLKDEVAWEKGQKADTRNTRFQIAVYLRDGDSCRYCGVVVQPNDNRSARGRTLDHLKPGQQARSADDLVVACRSCNGARGKDWQDEDARDGFAARWPLRQPPVHLIFIRSTVTWLEEKGHTIPPGSVIAERANTPARDTPTQTSDQEATRSAHQAEAAAPGRSTTAPDDQHPTTQVGVATPGTGTTGATRPTSQVGAAAPPSAADQHPAPVAGVAAAADSLSAPECQHPANAGVAAPESRTDRSPTDRCGTAGPGRVGLGSGSGREGSPPTRASPGPPVTPPQSPSITAPRRTRRGRRRPRTGTTTTDQPTPGETA